MSARGAGRWTSRSRSRTCAGGIRASGGLRGGETLRLGPGWRVEVLALPGHTPGHLGLWDPRSGAAIVIDAVLCDGVYDRAGNRLIPPRYYSARDHEATIRTLRALDPALLLTAHYDVMERDAARAFLDRSLAFVAAVRDAAADAGGRCGGRPVPELHARARGVGAGASGRGLSVSAV
jgi:glyoxylase-like metal-dependent hydrolase (beta-lactamase superfamily II)